MKRAVKKGHYRGVCRIFHRGGGGGVDDVDPITGYSPLY